MWTICSSFQNETRFAVDLNNFGFYANGILEVNLSSLYVPETVDYSDEPVRNVQNSVNNKMHLDLLTKLLSAYT